MATMASKGALEDSSLGGREAGLEDDEDGGFVRSVIEVEERRSVAEATMPLMPELVDCSCDDVYMLSSSSSSALRCHANPAPSLRPLPELGRFGRGLREWGGWWDVPLHGKWQFIAPRHILHHDVLLFDACLLQCLFGAFDKRRDDFRVPASMDDANS